VDTLAVVDAMDLSINGERRSVSSVAALRNRLAHHRATRYLEVWLSRPGGPALCVLANGPHAWLMYLRQEGDAGCSSRNPRYDGPADATRAFLLSNGQLDRYPAAWTIPTDAAFRAAEHFFLSGDQDPAITWHDDSVRDA
jgi:hypothetical protein